MIRKHLVGIHRGNRGIHHHVYLARDGTVDEVRANLCLRPL